MILKTIGINPGHDSSVALINEKGEIIFAAAEERFNRIKVFSGWPYKALQFISKNIINKKHQVNIAIANNKANFLKMEKRSFDLMFNDCPYFDNYNNYSFKFAFGSREKINSISRIKSELKSSGIKFRNITFYDHHLCHAASAYFTSGFVGKTLVLTADGSGDSKSSSAYVIENKKWKLLSETYLPHSPGHMYSWVTRYLGYKVGRHEGKITGLAAFGNPEKILKYKGVLCVYNKKLKRFENPYLIDQKQKRNFIYNFFCRLRGEIISPSYRSFQKKLPNKIKPVDLAALAQEDLEESIIQWANDMLYLCNSSQIAAAGGVFANVKLNQKIAEIKNVKKLWIFPDMGDGGLSIGAGYLSIAAAKSENLKINQNSALKHVYHGPTYSAKDVYAAAKKLNLKVTRLKDPSFYAAEQIVEGKLVGWMQNKMEFGPRALGNRSILAHPSNKDINQSINQRLRRTEFMPFAPSVLGSRACDIFSNFNQSRINSKFMTITFKVKNKWQSKLAAVTHVDGTARPQIVTKKINPKFFRLIYRFFKLTGIPAIVNTSFNMHEEPIVMNPYDAMRSYLSNAVDILVIGDFSISKNEN